MSHLKPPPKYAGPIFEPEPDAVLGPAEERALADARRAMAHPSYLDGSHPQHELQVAGVADLLVSVYGSPAEIAERLKKKGGG
jgi:hypothetical protein